MTVNNGGTGVLLIEGVHAGEAGWQRSPAGVLSVACKPNLGRIRAVGGEASFEGVSYRIARVTPSPLTAGFVRIELAPADGAPTAGEIA